MKPLWFLSALFSASLALAQTGPPAPPTPFTQCPTIGAATSCGVLIVINADGSVSSYTDPAVLPIDNNSITSPEDTSVGVQNNSTFAINNLTLDGAGLSIFGCDDDGDGVQRSTTGSCATYTPSGVQFTNINATKSSGTVAFNPPMNSGEHRNFALEGQPTSASITILPTIQACPTDHAIVNQPYGPATLAATGIPGGFRFMVSTGQLPNGLNLTGPTISGTPKAAGLSNFILQVTDSRNQSSTLSCGITIYNPVVVGCPAGTALPGVPYASAIPVTGGNGNYYFSAVSGTLPTGFTQNMGSISSTSPVAGTTGTFTVQVADSAGNTGVSPNCGIAVGTPVTIPNACPLPVGEVSAPYPLVIGAMGGNGNYRFSASSLPPGLGISSATGAITGTPTTTGTFPSPMFQATDGFTTANFSCPITINPPPSITTACPLPTATTGLAYPAQTIQAVGGTGPYTFAAAPSLASIGLTLTPTGTLMGIPTASGLQSFTLTVTDALRVATTKACSINVGSPVKIATTCAAFTTGEIGVPYPATKISATGGIAAIQFSAPTLPPNLSIDRTTGIVAGTPSAAGNGLPVTIQASDGNTSDSLTCAINVNSAPVVTTACPLPTGTMGLAYPAQTIQATGGTGPYTFTAAPSLSGIGLTLTPAGNLTGTPSAAGLQNFNLTVTDALGIASSKACSINVGSPVKITTTCPAFTTGEISVPYPSTKISATGGIAPIQFSAPTLPANLTIDKATGIIAGTPGAAGNGLPVTIQASDGNTSDSLSCAINVNAAPTITTACPLPTATVGVSYPAQSIQVTAGTGPYTFPANPSLAALGLSVNPSGGIAGVPSASAVGAQSFNLTATDAFNVAATKACSVTVDPQLVIIGLSAPSAVAGVNSALSVVATGGSGKYANYTLTPPVAGLTINPATGAIAGSASLAGSYPVTVTVTDSLGITASKTLAIVVSPGITTPCPLPPATIRTPYGAPLSAFGLNGLAVWTLLRGSLPPGLQIVNGASAFISGTPTGTPGTFPITLQVTDASGNMAAFDCGISVDYPQLTGTTACPLPDGAVGTPYLQSLSGTGGSGAISYSIGGSLPPGLFLDNNNIRGTPSASGSFSFNLLLGSLPPQSCGITVKTVPVTITGGCPLPDGKQNVSYSAGVAASGGTPPYKFGAAGLPASLGIDPVTGAISGKPSATGTSTVTLSATDSAGTTATQQCGVSVVRTPLSISTACPFNSGMVDKAYSQSISVIGGSSPYSFAASGLPGGLSIDPATGVISGKPTTQGTFSNVAVQVSDSNGSASLSCPIMVTTTQQPPAVGPCALPNGRQNSSYNQPLSVVSGTGTAPFTWASQSGATLPPGISVTADGSVRGTPTSVGMFSFGVVVTDNLSLTGSGNCSLVVYAPLTISSVTPSSILAGGTQDTPITVTGTGFTTDSTVLWNGTPLNTTFVSSTQLTAVVPASAVGTPGAATIAVSAPDVVSPNFTFPVQLPTAPVISLTFDDGNPPVLIEARKQPVIKVKLASAYAFDIQGTVTLSVAPDPAVGKADPMVRFMPTGSSTTFTIKAGTLVGGFDSPFNSTGTLAGTFTFQISGLQSQGIPLPAPASVVVMLNASVPVITNPAPCFTATGSTVQVQVSGYTTTRKLQSATFVFTPAAGAILAQSSFPVPLDAASATYFGSDASIAMGGQFTLTQPFTLQGDAAIDSVAVTLTNAAGTSASMQGKQCQ